MSLKQISDRRNTMRKVFYTPVDKRNKTDMIDFLATHFRYYSMNPWNRATSYANNMKVNQVGLDSETIEKIYVMMDIPNFYNEINFLLGNWAESHNYRWQAGFNGRSDGYLVLYQGALEQSEYKSFCTDCGQKNYKSTEENGIICGRCKQPARIDYSTPPKRVVTYPGKGTDMGEDFKNWDIESLRDRVELVQSFDMLCDEIIILAIEMAHNYDIVEEEILIPKYIKTLQARGD